MPRDQDRMPAAVLSSSSGQLCLEMSRDTSSWRDGCCVPLAWLSPAPGPEEHLLTLQARPSPPSCMAVKTAHGCGLEEGLGPSSATLAGEKPK